MRIELTNDEFMLAAAQHVIYILPLSQSGGDWPLGAKSSVHFADGSSYYSTEDPVELDKRRQRALIVVSREVTIGF